MIFIETCPTNNLEFKPECAPHHPFLSSNPNELLSAFAQLLPLIGEPHPARWNPDPFMPQSLKIHLHQFARSLRRIKTQTVLEDLHRALTVSPALLKGEKQCQSLH